MDKKNIANNRPADIANFCRPQPPKPNPFRLMYVVRRTVGSTNCNPLDWVIAQVTTLQPS